MHKMLWFDTETTGTDPEVHDVLKLAGRIVIDGKVVDSFDLRAQPMDYDSISEKALEVNGLTVEEIRTFPEAKEMYIEFKALMDKYIDNYNKSDKFVPCGQNVRFDMDFVYQLFKKQGDPYWFSYVFSAPFDTLSMAVMLEVKEGKKIFVPSYKLETLCKRMDVPLDNAHDALADIDATRAVASKMWVRLTQ